MFSLEKYSASLQIILSSWWEASRMEACFIYLYHVCQREHQGGRSPSALFPPLQLCCNRAQVTCVYERTCLIFSLQTRTNPLCIAIVLPLFTFPPLLKGPPFPGSALKCELNEGFDLSCGYWHAIIKRIASVFLWKCHSIASGVWMALGCTWRLFPRILCPLGANYNWTIPWKWKFASPLVNWALIIFTL